MSFNMSFKQEAAEAQVQEIVSEQEQGTPAGQEQEIDEAQEQGTEQGKDIQQF